MATNTVMFSRRKNLLTHPILPFTLPATTGHCLAKTLIAASVSIGSPTEVPRTDVSSRRDLMIRVLTCSMQLNVVNLVS